MAIKRVSTSYYASTCILNEMINSVANASTTTTSTTTTTSAPASASASASVPVPVPSNLQTKDWRKQQSWYKGGKSNECEILQRMQIQQITGKECPKTTTRINKRTHEMQPLSNPLTRADGFDWTEDFDGMQKLDGNDGAIYNMFYNFKMVCDAGGSQTRTLREVYSFVEAQQQVLLIGNHANVHFINILDGDRTNEPYWRVFEKGNTILMQMGKGKYLFVGKGILSFSAKNGDTIRRFYSPMGGNYDSFPYAVGDKYVYLLNEKKCAPISEFDMTKDVMRQYYCYEMDECKKYKTIALPMKTVYAPFYGYY